MGDFNVLVMDENDTVKTNLRCSLCSMSSQSALKTNCMDGIGPVNPVFMFVGFAPGREDDNIGEPMTGANGRLFCEIIEDAGLRKEEVFITNCVKCAPFTTEPKDAHWNACKTHFHNELKRINPVAIVSVGAPALKWLTGYGSLRNFRRHAIPCLVDPKIPVFPIEQPARIWHVEGAAKTAVRNSIVEDIRWLVMQYKLGKLKLASDTDFDYKTAYTIQDVKDFLEEINGASPIACDIETCNEDCSAGVLDVHTDNSQIQAIGFSIRSGYGRAIPLYSPGIASYFWWTKEERLQIVDMLVEFFKNNVVFGHNFVQFDSKWIFKHLGIVPTVDFDTQYASYLLCEDDSLRLEDLAVRYGGMLPWKSTKQTQNTVELCTYLCKDVDATIRVRAEVEKQLTPTFKHLLTDLFLPLGATLREMEYTGVYIDREQLDAVDRELASAKEVCQRAIREMPEVQAFELAENTTLNTESPDHLAKIMEHYLKLPCLARTAKGKYSTGKEVLNQLKDSCDFVAYVLEQRQLVKLHGTYCTGMKERLTSAGKIHTNYNTTKARTGRLASNDPNLQNIPRADTAGKVIKDGKVFKKIFIPPPQWYCIQADLNQIELRIMAALSGDKALQDAYRQGQDVHKATAASVYGIPIKDVTSGQRFGAKCVNFGIIYGRGIVSIAAQFIQEAYKQCADKAKAEGKFPSKREFSIAADKAEAEANKFYFGHKEKFPGVWRFMDNCIREVRKTNQISSVFGLTRRFEAIGAHEERAAMNHPIQSPAATITNYALYRIHNALKELKMKSYLALTVHDSIIAFAPEEEVWDTAVAMKTVMELPWDFLGDVPIIADVEIGPNWGDLKKVDPEKRVILD